MIPETISTILFDVDDTLFDRRGAQQEICMRIYRGFPELFSGLDLESVRKAFHLSDEMVNERIDAGCLESGAREERSRIFLSMLGIGTSLAQRITEAYMKLYPDINLPIEGAHSILQKLSGAFRLGVVSNGFRDIQYHKLEVIGISSFFECVILSDEIGIRKPDRRIFLSAAESLQVLPKECLYVGDSYEYDVLGAKSSGMLACWFTRQDSSYHVSDILPDMKIESLWELPALLNQSM